LFIFALRKNFALRNIIKQFFVKVNRFTGFGGGFLSVFKKFTDFLQFFRRDKRESPGEKA